MITGYHLFCYTDFVPDAETRYDVGSSLIGCTIFTVIVNISMILKSPVFEIFTKVSRLHKKYWFRKDKIKLLKIFWASFTKSKKQEHKPTAQQEIKP